MLLHVKLPKNQRDDASLRDFVKGCPRQPMATMPRAKRVALA